MHYINYMNCVVIYGGRNCSDLISKESKQPFLNDIWLLHIQRLEWLKLNAKGDIPPCTYAHNSWVYGSEFIVFGGMNKLALNSTISMMVCELHEVRAKEIAEKKESKELGIYHSSYFTIYIALNSQFENELILK